MPRAPLAPKTPPLYRAAFWLLLCSGLIFLVLPLPLPRPLRFAVAGGDFIAASVIWLAVRQRTRPPAR